MSGLVKDFKTLLGIDTVVALAMCSVMWFVYYYTDFKFSREFTDPTPFDMYFNKGVIGLTLFAGVAGGFYFVNKLVYSMLNTGVRLALIALIVGTAGYALYIVGVAPKNFLQSDVALLCIFSGMSLLLLLMFGWKEPVEVENARIEQDIVTKSVPVDEAKVA